MMGTGVADVFIEYVSADRDRVDAIVRALKSSGIAAEWDEAFRFSLPRDEREQARAACKIVFIIWSQTSTASRFFQKEMEGVVERHIAVPILVDDSRVPLWLREQNAFDLGQWNGHPNETAWHNVAEHIKPFIDAKGGPSLQPRPYVAPGQHPDTSDKAAADKAAAKPDTAARETKRQPCAAPQPATFVLPPELKSRPLKAAAPAAKTEQVEKSADAKKAPSTEQTALAPADDSTPFSDFSGTTIDDDDIKITADDIFVLTDVLYDDPAPDEPAKADPATITARTAGTKTEGTPEPAATGEIAEQITGESTQDAPTEIVDESDLIDAPITASVTASNNNGRDTDKSKTPEPVIDLGPELHESKQTEKEPAPLPARFSASHTDGKADDDADDVNDIGGIGDIGDIDTSDKADNTPDTFDALELAPGRRLKPERAKRQERGTPPQAAADQGEQSEQAAHQPAPVIRTSSASASTTAHAAHTALDTDPLTIIPRPLISSRGRLAQRQFPAATLGIAAAMALVMTIATAPQLQFWHTENLTAAADYTHERLEDARTAWSDISETLTTTHPQQEREQSAHPSSATDAPAGTAADATGIATASVAAEKTAPTNGAGAHPSAHDQLIREIEAVAKNAQNEAEKVAAKARIAAARARDNAPGHGILYYENGSRYEGEVANGQRDGVGVYYYASGSRYEGQYKDDMRGALGAYHFAHGDVYQGHFQEGQLSGYGVYAFADGTSYLGELFDGTFNGLGMKRAEDGTVAALGTWHHNTLSVPWQTNTTSADAQTF